MHLRPRQRPVCTGTLMLALCACTNDLPAPDLYEGDLDTDSSASATTGSSALSVDCSDIPQGAVDATFGYAPTVMGGDSFYTFAATELPEGLAIDATTGQIMGVPTTEGTYMFDVTVMDTSGGMGQATCELDVNPALSVDLDLDKVPYCAYAGETLLDFLVEGTGDGTDIVCEHVAGEGNGKTPEGITVDPDSCAVQGTVQEDRLGTWVFMVRGTQSDAEVWLPYCVTNDQGMDYDITVEHTMAGVDNTLVPLMRTYDTSAPLDVGGGGDPYFEIIDPSSCSQNSCYYGYAYSINASPFAVGMGNPSLSPSGLVYDAGNAPIGFSHELSITGPQVTGALAERPWVVNLDLDYCLTTNEPTCDGPENIRQNGAGNLEFGIIMVPQ